MKMNKILAVLLSVALLCGLIPAFSVSAAVGAITNGDFETGDLTGWEYYSYSTSIGSSYKRNGSYGVKIGKDSTLAGHVALEQIVPVNTGATYKLTYYNKRSSWGLSGNCSFSVSVELGTTPTSFTATGLSATTPSNGNSFTQRSHSFSTSTYKYARIRFNALGSGVDTCLDDIVLTATTVGDTSTHAAPALVAFGTRLNWPTNDLAGTDDPADCDNNLVVEPGFETTTNAAWNNTGFLTNDVKRVTNDPEGAHSGSSYLKYNRGSTAPTTWSFFEVTINTPGRYVFSAWVRTPYLSSNNTGKASIGIMDPTSTTSKFLTYGNSGGSYDGHYSTPEIQIRSTATDNKWHLRSVVFDIGVAGTKVKIGMYGLKSEMYVDDISIHLESNGVEYAGNQHGSLSASNLVNTNATSTSTKDIFCDVDYNLIVNGGMTGDNAKEFWTTAASGWNNGFLEFAQDPQAAERGDTLHYKGTNPGSNKLYNYIKFIYVKPNTSYTVSFDYRVAAAGNQLMFIDNNIRSPQIFHTPDLGSANNNWKTYAFTFTTGNYNRIGIVLRDSTSAELYLDDFRFFESSYGKTTEPEEEIYANLKHKDNVATSRNEMNDGKFGLAFKFQLDCVGAVRIDDGAAHPYYADYSNAYVDVFLKGDLTSYKLIATGALITNDESIGTDEKLFDADNAVAGSSLINVQTTKLYEGTDHIVGNGYITYAVRVTNIPDEHVTTTIYARPYYIFDYNGREVIIYGEIQAASYEKAPDINDGQFGGGSWG